jgi:membrane-associated phospholipid phosphatase
MEKEMKLTISKPENAGLLVSEILAVTGISFLCIWGFARITSKLQTNHLQPFKTDIRLLDYFNSKESPSLTRIMNVIASLANFKGIALIAGPLTFGFFKSKNNSIYSFEIPAVAIGCEILNLIFKAKYKRIRPAGHALRVRGWSYPSGHAMVSISFYGFLTYLLVFKSSFPKGIIAGGSFFLIFLIFLIGISRSYLKAHFPSDVVAGYALGFLWLVGSLSMIHQLEGWIIKDHKTLSD